MTNGSFVDAGASAVHAKPSADIMDPIDVDALVEHREKFRDDVRTHMSVLGPQGVLESISAAHQWLSSDAVRAKFSPTQKLVADFAVADPEGWSAVLRIVADVIGEVRDERQAASRA